MFTPPHSPSRHFLPVAAGVLLCWLLATLFSADPAPAAWPGGNGAIAFSRNAHAGRGGGDIWIRKTSGGERRLTSARSANDGEPTYSRDGRQIAFSRYAGGDFDIWVMNSDGTHKRAVTATDRRISEVEPAFLPSGRALVFAQIGGPGAGDVYSIGVDGRRRQLQARNARSPVVSPDGRWLAFRRQPGGERLRLKNLRTGAERQLASGLAQEPDFSPDGRRLVFVGKRPCGGQLRQSLLTIGLDARRPRMLLDFCHRSYIPFGPAFAPRGNRVVFTRLSRRSRAAGASDVRLQMLNTSGTLVPGAPRHRGTAFESSPSWQPLR